MSIIPGYEYSAKFVKHKYINGVPATSFVIGDKIKDAPTTQYQNFDFTVWGEHVAIPEGAKVVLESIKRIDCRSYNGMVKFSLSGDIRIKPNANIVFVDETVAYTPTQKPESKIADDDYLQAILDDDTPLPFDL